MPGSVQCSRCSKVLPTGGGFCRRCGWPTTHAVAVPGEGPPPLTPPGFFPPLPSKEDTGPPPAPTESWWAVVPVVIVLIALVSAGLAGRRSFLARRAQAADAAANTTLPGGEGTWRVIQGQSGQALRDFLVADVRQLGARGDGGTPLPHDALRVLKVRGRRLPYGLECVVVNKSQWTIREVSVETRTWQNQHTTRTVVYRVACDLRPGRTGATAIPLPLEVGPDQRTELRVISALGDSPSARPRRW